MFARSAETINIYSKGSTNDRKNVTISEAEQIVHNIFKLEKEYIRLIFDLSGISDFVQELDKILSDVDVDGWRGMYLRIVISSRINKELLDIFEKYKYRYIFLDKNKRDMCLDLENWVKISNERCNYLQRIDEEYRNLKNVCDMINGISRASLKRSMDDINVSIMQIEQIEINESSANPEMYKKFYRMLKDEYTWHAVREIKSYINYYQNVFKSLECN